MRLRNRKPRRNRATFPMNACCLRGVAVLALLSALPRVSALTVQSNNSPFGGSGMTDGSSGGWTKNGFDFEKSSVPLGSLQIDVTWGYSITSWEKNTFADRTLNIVPFVEAETWFVIENDLWTSSQTYAVDSGEPVVIQPSQYAYHTGTFSHTATFFISDAAVLDELTGSGYGRFLIHERFYGFGNYGGVYSTGTASVVLTFNALPLTTPALSAPDAGSASGFLALTIAGLFYFHRLKNRSFPT
jgi:hypothetical protein